jgi:hypothetical protein
MWAAGHSQAAARGSRSTCCQRLVVARQQFCYFMHRCCRRTQLRACFLSLLVSRLPLPLQLQLHRVQSRHSLSFSARRASRRLKLPAVTQSAVQPRDGCTGCVYRLWPAACAWATARCRPTPLKATRLQQAADQRLSRQLGIDFRELWVTPQHVCCPRTTTCQLGVSDERDDQTSDARFVRKGEDAHAAGNQPARDGKAQLCVEMYIRTAAFRSELLARRVSACSWNGSTQPANQPRRGHSTIVKSTLL